MKKLLYLVTATLLFASCESAKLGDPKPVSNKPHTTNSTAPNAVNLSIADHVVKTSVSHDTLYLSLNEKADLIISQDDYNKASAVHFKEDFSASGLSGLHFSTLNGDGDIAYDYIDDNLNNVNLPAATTAIVNGKTVVKLHVERTIVFFKAYQSQQLAVQAQTGYINKNKDMITFSSYIFDDKDNAAVSLTVGLSYTK
ncbi:hypothetical protein [Mucilaginibacter aquaedulcis]|uniref:hypothetical protein n=1 Tax=Mucilaginibacter aquaedulcis TaxID=1187081 RepID=UPI0025B4F91B|nr:hypothetical protein [Mucilaginibacter aquaedulcis]MDN3549859.1 hypothetical protein [Mucilaginibacter aquaedulcis]